MLGSALVSLALDDCLPDDYPVKEGVSMKVKTTFYSRKSGKDFDPVIHTVFPKSRADQLSYQPTSKLIDQMIRTGQMVLASKSQFDFPDGKDDGRDVPVDRLRGLDYPEISQMMADNESKLKEHEKNLSEISAKGKKSSAGSGAGSGGESDGKSAASDGENAASSSGTSAKD